MTTTATETQNVLIVGVGGQGVLRCSQVLSNALVQQGYDVKQSEVHGMSQRGGSVVSEVRFGQKVYSPLSPLADDPRAANMAALGRLSRHLDVPTDVWHAAIEECMPPKTIEGNIAAFKAGIDYDE